nr:hypothetical protein [bacterium]
MSKKAALILAALLIIIPIIAPAQSLLGAQEAARTFALTLLPALLPAVFGAQLIQNSLRHASAKGPWLLLRAWGLSAICGCPSGSLAMENAIRLQPRLPVLPLALLSSAMSPGFLISALPAMAGTKAAAPVFFISQHVSAFLCALIALLFCHRGNGRYAAISPPPPRSDTYGPSEIALLSVKAMAIAATFAIVMGAAWGGLQGLRLLELPLAWMRKGLEYIGGDASLAESLLLSIFEMPSGCANAATSGAALGQRLIAMAALSAWGGLPVLLQQFVVLQGVGLKFAPFAALKALQALLAGGCAWLMVLGLEIPVFCLPMAASPNAWGFSILAASAVFTYSLSRQAWHKEKPAFARKKRAG